MPRSDLAAATDLDAVLVGPWEPSSSPLVRFRIPLVLVLAAAFVVLPLSFSGEVPGLAVTAILVVAAGAVGIFLVAMQARAGTRLIGYSPRGVYAPALQPWERITRIHTANSSAAGRVIAVETGEGVDLQVPIPRTVTEPEYRAFLAAIQAAAKARGIRVS